MDEHRDRDPETGQFVTSMPPEPEVGRVAALHEAGYKTLEEHRGDEPAPEYASPREAARDVEPPQADQEIGKAIDATVDAYRPAELPDDVALTPREAAARYKQHAQAEQIADEVAQDEARAVEMLTDAGYTPAEASDFYKEFILQQRQPQQQPAQQPQPQPQQQPVDPQQAQREAQELIERNPVLRAELETRVRAAEEAQQQYLQSAQQLAGVAYADLIHEAQELRKMGYDSYEKLLRENPQKAIDYRQKTDRVQALVAEGQRAAAHQQQYQQAVVRHGYAQATVAMVERHPELAQRGEMEKAQQQIAEMLRDHRMDVSALPPQVFVSADAQEFLYQAARRHAAEKQLKAGLVTKPSTPVLKPGVQVERPNRDAHRIAEIDRQLGSATGNRAIKLAAERYTLRQKGR
jgi:hypothetical protein